MRFAEACVEAHDDFFTDRVDRRVGNLGKLLLEEVAETALLRTERRQRGVVPHRADGFLPVSDHRFDDLFEDFFGKVEIALTRDQVLRREAALRGILLLDVLLQVNHVLVEPLHVRLGRLEVVVDLVVFEHLAEFEVEAEHLARLQAAALFDILLGDVADAVFTRDQQGVVVRDDVLGRAQAVTVEHAADVAAVGEREGRRTVPGFENGGVVFVEGTQVRVHVRGVLPRRRDDGAGGFEEIHAVDDQELQEVVGAGAVGRPRLQDRQQAFKLFLRENLALDRLGFDADVETVRFDGVDLPVVCDGAERLGQAPFRKRIGREALVKERERDLEIRVLQVFIELLDVGRHDQALERDDLGGHGRDVEILVGDERVLGLFAAEVQQRIETLGRHNGIGHDEDVIDVRLALDRLLPERVVVDGHFAFEHDLQIVLRTGLSQDLEVFFDTGKNGGHREHIRQLHAVFQGDLTHERRRHGKQQAAAVAGFAVGGDGAAVHHAFKRGNRAFERLMRHPVVDIGDQTETAVIFKRS